MQNQFENISAISNAKSKDLNEPKLEDLADEEGQYVVAEKINNQNEIVLGKAYLESDFDKPFTPKTPTPIITQTIT